MKKKIFVLTLGCPRNILDSEILSGLLDSKGYTLVDDPEEADLGIVNTCGFVKDAKEESIDAILRLAELKKTAKMKKLVVTGCLSQRYSDDLMNDIKEIDGIYGTGDFQDIPLQIDTLFEGKKIKNVSKTPEFLYDHNFERKMIASSHYAYVKIEEGCSHKCSFCVIPELKGPLRSRSIGSVVKEVKYLKSMDKIREYILIGQDTTSFGLDSTGKIELPDLLEKVSDTVDEGWIRLLYTHPTNFSNELIDIIASKDNICKYIDMPIQHINDSVLERMYRFNTKKQINDLITSMRSRIDDLAIRTSIIVGFPGETEDEFNELLEYLEEVKFERLGAFIYSQEEGTPSAEFEGQVPEEVKNKRFDAIMSLQQKISSENNEKYLGKQLKVLIDEKDPEDPEQFIGRTQMDAPEVDGNVYVKGENIQVGNIIDVVISGTLEYDFIGKAL